MLAALATEKSHAWYRSPRAKPASSSTGKTSFSYRSVRGSSAASGPPSRYCWNVGVGSSTSPSASRSVRIPTT